MFGNVEEVFKSEWKERGWFLDTGKSSEMRQSGKRIKNEYYL